MHEGLMLLEKYYFILKQSQEMGISKTMVLFIMLGGGVCFGLVLFLVDLAT